MYSIVTEYSVFSLFKPIVHAFVKSFSLVLGAEIDNSCGSSAYRSSCSRIEIITCHRTCHMQVKMCMCIYKSREYKLTGSIYYLCTFIKLSCLTVFKYFTYFLIFNKYVRNKAFFGIYYFSTLNKNSIHIISLHSKICHFLGWHILTISYFILVYIIGANTHIHYR